MKGLLITYGLTAYGAIAGLVVPFHALLVYVLLSIVKPEAMWPWSFSGGRYSLIVAVSMVVGWVCSRTSTFTAGRGGGVIGPLLGFLVWATLGAVTAPDQELGWLFVETLVKIVVPVGIGLTMIESTRQLKQLAWVIVLGQGYVALELNRTYFSGYNILAAEGFGSLDNNSAAIALVTALGLAGFLTLHVERLWQKCLLAGMVAVLGHAVLFSYSRGGMLAMLVSAACAFFLIPKRPRHYVLFALAVVTGLSLAGEEVRARFMSAFEEQDGEREASAQSRLDLWANCWDVMQKHPITGCGPNQWPVIAPEYGWPKGKEAHSLWMQTGAELGFPGLALLVSFYGICVIRLWKLTWRRCDVEDPFHRSCARMVITSLIGFMLSAQFVSLEALEIPYFVAMLGAGTLKLHSQWQRKERLAAEDLFDEEYAHGDSATERDPMTGGPGRWLPAPHPA